MKRDCTTCKHTLSMGPCRKCITRIDIPYWEPEEKEETEMKIQVEETKEPKMPYHERLIEDLKAAGQSIVDNAESIIGSERWLHQVRVMITLNPSEATMVNIDRDFYPEGIIK